MRSDTIGVMEAITRVPAPVNEPNLDYAPGSAERAALEAELARQERLQLTFKATIGGRKVAGKGAEVPVVQPHDHQHVLGVIGSSTQAETRAAIKAATDAAPGWRALPSGRAGGRAAPRRRPAGRSVAGQAERGHHARASPRPPGRPRSTRPAS